MKEFNELIIKKETGIDKEIFKNCFGVQKPSALLKNIYNLIDETENNKLVSVNTSGLSDFKTEIEKMTEDEIEIEKPYEILDTVEKILEFNRQQQQGQRLKMLTPNQMLSRLPISLALLKAQNNY